MRRTPPLAAETVRKTGKKTAKGRRNDAVRCSGGLVLWESYPMVTPWINSTKSRGNARLLGNQFHFMGKGTDGARLASPGFYRSQKDFPAGRIPHYPQGRGKGEIFAAFQRPSFPGEDVIRKVLYLRVKAFYNKWNGHAIRIWSMIRNQPAAEEMIQARMLKDMSVIDKQQATDKLVQPPVVCLQPEGNILFIAFCRHRLQNCDIIFS